MLHKKVKRKKNVVSPVDMKIQTINVEPMDMKMQTVEVSPADMKLQTAVSRSEPPLNFKLKHRFVFWLETSTSHGLPNIARTERWILRIIWTLCFLTSLSYCSYVIITSFIEFFKYQTTVSITKVNELPTDFPAITMCNVNPFNERRARTYLDKIRTAIDVYDCVLPSNPAYVSPNCTETYLYLDYFLDKLKRVVANDKTMNETMRNEYGFKYLEDMCITSSYNNDLYDANKFYKTWSHEYGFCYTFNSGKTNDSIHKTSASGLKYGFWQEILLKPADVETVYAYQDGLYLIVHNQTELPFTLDSGIFIPPGVQAFIGVSRVFKNKLDGLYSNCIRDLTSSNPYAQKLFGYFKELNVNHYNQKFCFTMCYQDKLVDACNCTDINTPTIRNARYCSEDDELLCMWDFLSNYSNSNLTALCEGACNEECSSVEYQLDVSTSYYPTLTYLRSLARGAPTMFPKNDSNLVEYAEQAALKINIYYDNLYYTSIHENPKTNIEDLLGNLGGQLGLFIGISFLSLVEVLELVVDLVIIYVEHRRISNQATIVESFSPA